MAHREVTHIRRDGSDVDRRIDMLAGLDWGPSYIDEVIRDILAGVHTYYVTAYLWEAPLELLRRPTSGRLFLRTVPDGLYDNNLYALPEIGAPRLGARLLRPGS